MKIAKATVLRAGNAYARRPVVEILLDAEPFQMLSPDQVASFFDVLPDLREEVLDFPGLRRLTTSEEPVPAAALVEVLAIIVQRYLNWPLRLCGWRSGKTGAETPAVFEIATRRIGLRASRIAVELLAAFLDEADADITKLFQEKIQEFARKTGHETPSLDAMAVARAAVKRGIVWSSLPGSSFLRIGSGQHAHVLMGSETTKTSSIGRALAREKSVTNAVLAAAGLPVARQKKVRRAEDARAAALELGFPVVIKPAGGNMGKGVSVGVNDEAGIVAAFQRAQVVSRDVLVESLIPGEEYRLLVIGGRFVAAVCRRPAQVSGDGIDTVRDLVARENARPVRETLLPGRMAARLPIVIDSEAVGILAEQGHREDTVPAKDEVVFLRRESNVSRGGDCVDETERVHSSIKAVAERAANVLGIDVCGVDFISSDIARPWRETGSAICEVNTRPGLCLHSHVSEGRQRDVAAEVVKMLYPKGAASRAPVVAVLDCPEGAKLQVAIESAAARAGLRLGVSLTGSNQHVRKETQRIENLDALTWNESIEAALVVVAAKDVMRRGLGAERIDLAILPAANAFGPVLQASAALARVAGNRVVSIDDPRVLTKALETLGLPKSRSPATPLPASARPAPAAHFGSDGFTALLVGDIGFGEFYMHHPRAASLQRLLGEHGHGYSFEKLRSLLGLADLVIGNLEAPLSAAPDAGLRGRKKYLCWSHAERAVKALKEAGFHAVTLANNHALDGGTIGLMETMTRLRDAGISSFGAGSDIETANRPFVARFQTGGVERSLAVFGCFEHRRRYENRYRWYARRAIAGVNELSAARIGAAIETLRKQLPRPIFVAYPHWGVDYTEVNDAQRESAKELVEAGVDLIIGHGSHTAQSFEMVDGRPVLYGTGNFVWNTPGRFAKLGAKPLGLVPALSFRPGASGLQARLRIYPILTDNDLTSFQNRPLGQAELAEMAPGMTDSWHQKPRMGADAAGCYFDLDLSLPPEPSGASALMSAATASIAPPHAIPIPRPRGMASGPIK